MPEDEELISEEGQGTGTDPFASAGEEQTDLDKIFAKMLAPENIFHFTELNAQEITAFSTLGVISKKYMPKGIIQDWLLDNLKLRVSKARKGKTEFVKITSRSGYQEQPVQSGGWNPFRR